MGVETRKGGNEKANQVEVKTIDNIPEAGIGAHVAGPSDIPCGTSRHAGISLTSVHAIESDEAVQDE